MVGVHGVFVVCIVCSVCVMCGVCAYSVSVWCVPVGRCGFVCVLCVCVVGLSWVHVGGFLCVWLYDGRVWE